jgi:hypothetical protein
MANNERRMPRALRSVAAMCLSLPGAVFGVILGGGCWVNGDSIWCCSPPAVLCTLQGRYWTGTGSAQGGCFVSTVVPAAPGQHRKTAFTSTPVCAAALPW